MYKYRFQKYAHPELVEGFFSRDIFEMNSFWVYILKCSDGSYYTGHTDNLEYRIAQHQNSCFDCYTSERLPVELVFQQEFSTRDEAFLAERKIKGWSRKKKEAMMRGDWKEVSRLAHKNPSTGSG